MRGAPADLETPGTRLGIAGRASGARGAVRVALVALLAVQAAATTAAMRHTSPTFDEITHVASGARGYATGDFTMVNDHPPLSLYVHGLPAHLLGVRLPDPGLTEWTTHLRYPYAQLLFYATGNDPERLLFYSRLPAVLTAVLLVLATYLFASRALGPGGGLLAAALTAFLPDVLAHGGVSYNDVPLALTFLLAAWASDAAIRRPTPARGALAGGAVALAVATKYSAVLLGPAIVLLAVLEGVSRRGDPEWRRALLRAAYAALAAGYALLVLVWLGDWSLADLRSGIRFKVAQVTEQVGSIPMGGYLLGRTNPDGFRWFFPIAFLLKTPAAFHLLGAGALAGFVLRQRGDRGGVRPQAPPTEPSWRSGLRSPLRLPLMVLLVELPVLLGAELNIGFRHALPALPFICVLVAAGTMELWRRGGRLTRAALLALVSLHVLSALSAYPHFLAYTNAYVRGSLRERPALVDSSADWGQGLLALRDWMQDEGIERVRLGYFGTGWPEAYGIRYEPLPSFYPLPEPTGGEDVPVEATVVSATLLVGFYVDGDPYAAFRAQRPDTVLAGSLYVYRARDGAAAQPRGLRQRRSRAWVLSPPPGGLDSYLVRRSRDSGFPEASPVRTKSSQRP